MRLYHAIFSMIMVCLGSLLYAEATPLINDPFIRSNPKSCHEQSENLLAALTKWQLKGVVSLIANRKQIWLYSESHWVKVTVNLNGQLSYETLPKSLLPWQIVAVSNNSVSWQAELSPICNELVNWEMQFLSTGVKSNRRY